MNSFNKDLGILNNMITSNNNNNNKMNNLNFNMMSNSDNIKAQIYTFSHTSGGRITKNYLRTMETENKFI